ncbi:HAMP domain-containing sensor histidine kinase [Sulfurimonas sp. HSL-1716]|uniref:sensor histidine kinase n=1 Tax=Hydrocurvibacter sulfurireducens TaxID=3131937 RepID=UPI0031F9CF26
MLLAEKRSLLKFVSVFVALNTVFLVTLSILYFNYQKNVYTEILQDEMVNYAETASESIYYTDNIEKLDDFLLHDARFGVALLDKKQKLIFPAQNSFDIKFKKGFSTYGSHYFYIKTIELDQIKEVHYLVVRADTIDEELAKTRRILYIVLFFSILFFGIVIFILSKLFLRPLREYIELLDRFIRDATHELNTPISVISMSLERLDKNDLSRKNIKSIQHIQVATKTLSHLYGDLTFLMFPSQSYPINKIRLDSLILQRIEYFMPLASAKHLRFSTQLQECEIMINEHIISRIIDNLLSNAIKYNKRGGEIKVSLGQDSLSISDTGIGFDTALSDQIFERYKRLENSSGGFGLGLSIVKSLCDMYDIDIQVHSQKDVGTTFTLSWKNSRIIHTS